MREGGERNGPNLACELRRRFVVSSSRQHTKHHKKEREREFSKTYRIPRTSTPKRHRPQHQTSTPPPLDLNNAPSFSLLNKHVPNPSIPFLSICKLPTVQDSPGHGTKCTEQGVTSDLSRQTITSCFLLLLVSFCRGGCGRRRRRRRRGSMFILFQQSFSSSFVFRSS